MSAAPVRLAVFAALLAVVFGGAALLGGAVGPEPSTADEPAHDAEPAGHDGMTPTHGDEGGHDTAATGSASLPGLAVAADGLRLALDRTTVAGGRRHLSFRIIEGTDTVVRDFDVEHTKRLHLIVVRRDLQGFQHLHPTMDAQGRWTAEVDVARGGTYRVFADFAVDGVKRTLGADLQVPGTFVPQAVPAPSDTTTDDHGLTVRRHTDGGTVSFDVLRDGRPINDELEDYLGAKGHLVTLRTGDLAYLHTHPDGDRLAFAVDLPSAGTYRSWVQFQLDGVVHTAAFTEEVDR